MAPQKELEEIIPTGTSHTINHASSINDRSDKQVVEDMLNRAQLEQQLKTELLNKQS